MSSEENIEGNLPYKVGDVVYFWLDPERPRKILNIIYDVVEKEYCYILDGNPGIGVTGVGINVYQSTLEKFAIARKTVGEVPCPSPSHFPSPPSSSSKPTNPKDAVGSDKIPLGLIPETAIALESLAFLEGALKYGRYNWRILGVRSSIYFDACLRHLFKWWNGEDTDASTRVHHLANARACLAIIIDSGVCKVLTDDRPPRANVGEYINSLEEEVKYLKALFRHHNPRQYVIGDENIPQNGDENVQQ